MTADSDEAKRIQALVDSLSARLAEGGAITTADVPAGWAELPVFQNLLRFARVNQALDANREAHPAATAMPDQIAHWHIVRLLGQGGMGDVWLGERAQGDVAHQVAIKRVRAPHPRFVQRLKQERQILAKLNHPNVASFIDAGVDANGLPWLALEYVDGPSLTDWCEQQQLSLKDRIRLFLKVCAGVAHAHRHLIVHRDLKPGNILVDAQGEPKLLDFGISKLLDGDGLETTAHSLTPSYAAPEQLRGGVISTATDVYALGLLLFRLLAGRLPATRQDQSLAQVLLKLDREETARPSDAARESALPYPTKQLEGDLDAIVFKALKLEPTARYAGASEMAADLERYLAREPVRARAPTWTYRCQRFCRRHATALGFAALAALGLMLGSVLALQQAARANTAADIAQAQAARAKGATQFLLRVFEQSDPLRQDARGAISLDEAFEDALKRARLSSPAQPLLAIDLLDDFGEVLANKGRFEEAEQLFGEALVLIDQHYPKTSPTRAETLANLVTLHGFQGQPERAGQRLDEALAIMRPQPTKDPILYGTLLMHAATRAATQRQYAEAETLAREALALHRQHMSSRDPRLPSTLSAMGRVLRSIDGRLSDAAPFLDEAVRLAEANQGADSAALIALINQQRSLFNALGDKDRTVRATERMLQIAQKAFPGTHPLHADALLELGSLRLILDPKSDGADLLQRAIAMYQSLSNIGELRAWRLYHGGLVNWSQWEEAMRVSDQALPRCQALDESAAECIYLRAERVIALAQSERGAQAMQEIGALEADVQRFGLTGVDTDFVMVKARAEALLASGEKTQAIAVLESLVTSYIARWGEDSSFTRQLKTCVKQWQAGERVYCTW